MADVKSSSQWRGDASGGSGTGFRSDSDELESLREEAKRLRQLVVQLSRIAIRNAVNMK
jgi:hypothetical protein